jgi:PPOX class probable F420-dependent enzyme
MDETDAARPPSLAADHPLATVTYVALTTYRRTGIPVSTPVWIAHSVDDPHLFTVITVDDTGKTKRLAHTERVEVRPCDVRGRVKDDAPAYRGTARVVRDGPGVESVRRSVVAKYGFPARFSDLADALGSKVGIRRAARAGILVAVDPTPLDDRETAAPEV